MINRIVAFWKEWKNTSIGKSVEDFYWNVLYTSVVAGAVAASQVVMAGQTDPQVIWGVFTTGVSVSFLKSLSLFKDKYSNPEIPNRPQ